MKTFREFNEDTSIDEVASILTRLKMARAARKSKAKRLIGAKRARKKIKIDKKTLMKRATKRARNVLAKRRLKGAKLSDLGAGQKVALSKYLDKKTAKISKMAKKLVNTCCTIREGFFSLLILLFVGCDSNMEPIEGTVK